MGRIPAVGGVRWTGPQQEEGLDGRVPAVGGFRWTGPQQEEGLDGQDPSSRRV